MVRTVRIRNNYHESKTKYNLYFPDFLDNEFFTLLPPRNIYAVITTTDHVSITASLH